MKWRNDEVEKALKEHFAGAAEVQDGVEGIRIEFENEEQTHQEVPEVDQGKTHFVGDDCTGGHHGPQFGER